MAKLASSTAHSNRYDRAHKEIGNGSGNGQSRQSTEIEPREGDEPAGQGDIGAPLEEKVSKAINDLEAWWKDEAVSRCKQTRRLRKTQILLPTLESHTKALACLQGKKKRCVGHWRRMAEVTLIIKRSEKVVKKS